MKRKRNLIEDSAYPLFITTTIIRWLPVFSDTEIAVESLRLFESLRIEMNMTVFAYCLMPSHIHAIMKSARMRDISIFMRRWKSLSAKIIIDRSTPFHPEWIMQFEENARHYKVRKDQNHQVWMPRFDDFAIRDDKQFEVKVNYIHGNPLRDGLVENWEDYPYSSIKDYLEGKNGFITIDCGQGKP